MLCPVSDWDGVVSPRTAPRFTFALERLLLRFWVYVSINQECLKVIVCLHCFILVASTVHLVITENMVSLPLSAKKSFLFVCFILLEVKSMLEI